MPSLGIVRKNATLTLFYNEISHTKIHMSDGPECLLHTSSLRTSILAIK